MNKAQAAEHIAYLGSPDYFNDIVKNGGDAPKLRVMNVDDVFHIYLYDPISRFWGIRAKDIIDELGAADGKDVVLHINCGGGEVFEARAMYSAIKDYSGTVRAQIDGICASAATYVAIACENISMIDGGIFMIHNAAGFCWGDHNDMIKQAEILLKITEGIADDYVSQTGKTKAEVLELMADETYMDATEALADGFIDEIKDLKQSDDEDDGDDEETDGEGDEDNEPETNEAAVLPRDEPQNDADRLRQQRCQAQAKNYELSAHNA